MVKKNAHGRVGGLINEDYQKMMEKAEFQHSLHGRHGGTYTHGEKRAYSLGFRDGYFHKGSKKSLFILATDCADEWAKNWASVNIYLTFGERDAHVEGFMDGYREK